MVRVRGGVRVRVVRVRGGPQAALEALRPHYDGLMILLFLAARPTNHPIAISRPDEKYFLTSQCYLLIAANI